MEIEYSKATSWMLLSRSYMYSVEVLACEYNSFIDDVILKQKFQLLKHVIPGIFTCIYNARHGIELFLKSLIIIQYNSMSLPCKYHKHDLGKLYECLKKGDEVLSPLNEMEPHSCGISKNDFNHGLINLEEIVSRYQSYGFVNRPESMPAEIFTQEDKANMRFRYSEEEVNTAIINKFKEIFKDVDNLIGRNINELNCMKRLLNEISNDMELIFLYDEIIGTSIAIYTKEKK